MKRVITTVEREIIFGPTPHPPKKRRERINCSKFTKATVVCSHISKIIVIVRKRTETESIYELLRLDTYRVSHKKVYHFHNIFL
jgi:hypothetical protein